MARISCLTGRERFRGVLDAELGDRRGSAENFLSALAGYAPERAFFGGVRVGRRSWVGKRVELNAMTSPQLVEYLERKLGEAGARGKVIPPEDELKKRSEQMYRTKHSEYVAEAIKHVISSEAIEEEFADKFLERFGIKDAEKYIKEGLKEDDTLPWREALENKFDDIQEDHSESLLEAVRERILKAVGSVQGEEAP